MQGIELEVHRWVPEIWTWYQQHRLQKALLAPDMTHSDLDAIDDLIGELIEHQLV